MEPVKCGAWPAFPKDISVFSVYFLVNNFHREKKMTITLTVASSLQKAKRMEYFHVELKCRHC